MRQQVARAPAAVSRPGPQTGETGRSTRQDRLGNAAVAEGIGGSQGSGAGNDEAIRWVDMDESMSSRKGEEAIDKRGVSRPDALAAGQEGALFGGREQIKFYTDATGTSLISKVPNGTACKLLEVGKSRAKVELRIGTEKKTGWVFKGYFTDQPALTPDDEHKGLKDDYVFSKFAGDHSPKDPKGKDTAQGYIGDCYFVAAMAAVANATPGTIKDAVKYDAKKGTYTVRFFEETGYNKFSPVYIEVDALLPTKSSNRADPVYAGDQGGPMWSAIIEKAYAKWKGGYDRIGKGGYGEKAMSELTGSRSQSVYPSSLKPEQVIPLFEQAKKDGKAIYAAIKSDKHSKKQSPLSGKGDGPYTGTITHTHRWNHVVPGTVRVTDKNGKAGSAWDTGSEGDLKADIRGSGVKSGSIEYKPNKLELTYDKDKGPAEGGDLEVDFDYQGLYNEDKILVANHAYAFEDVVNGGKELQFYNPWGTWQPKPITPAEFLDAFSIISTNQPPKGATTT
jgi:hypothetical protein